MCLAFFRYIIDRGKSINARFTINSLIFVTMKGNKRMVMERLLLRHQKGGQVGDE
jgi:hypothetical protein